jgi:hypothetical protein
MTPKQFSRASASMAMAPPGPSPMTAMRLMAISMHEMCGNANSKVDVSMSKVEKEMRFRNDR